MTQDIENGRIFLIGVFMPSAWNREETTVTPDLIRSPAYLSHETRITTARRQKSGSPAQGRGDDLGYARSSNRSRAIFSRHTSGPVWWTLSPVASTATVTGMSFTSNS